MLNGYKTYLAALGLVGLGIYQLSTGDVQHAMQSFMQAAVAAGLRNALTNLLPPPA